MAVNAFAQSGRNSQSGLVSGHTEVITPETDTTASAVDSMLDVIDVLHRLVNKNAPKRRKASDGTKSNKLRVSAIPAAGYTLQTGFAALLSANAAFHTEKTAKENVSVIVTSITYSQYKQIILPVLGDIWTKNNKYNIQIDWRYLKYPSLTYGLGSYTKLSDGYDIDYSTVRLHQTVLRSIGHDLFFGLGYNLDYYWNIKETDPPSGKETDFESYDAAPNKDVKNTELASGYTLNFLHDSRGNPINPLGGDFIDIIYRDNPGFLGNDTRWQSMILDLRKYVRFPANSNNVLAFWNYDWVTLNGNPPYLMLPNTGSDPSSNSGRGYIQGRFRDKNMLYLEGEYRFQITHNGILGGVVFANAETFSHNTFNSYGTIAPGYGAGLRLKLNKFSRTNLGLDYGFGTGGSKGFFVNLGEVF